MANERLTRRDFVRTGAAAAGAVAAGLTPIYTVKAGNPDEAKTDGILNYNPDMEYRRCGRTELMVSAVCMGGHWKRLNEVIPGLFQKKGRWLSAKLDDPDFEKNRYDVVTRLIERGINYIDACTCEEVQMYSKAGEDGMLGLTIFSADASEVVVVNIMGDINPRYYGDVMVALNVDGAPEVKVANVN